MRFGWVNLFVVLSFVSLSSCSNKNKLSAESDSVVITQRDDGTISLDVEKATCYHNRTDPSLNTAEWSIKITKPGRYGVWLVSAAKDTMNLGYRAPVTIDINGERLEVKPVGNKIVRNAGNVKSPYYRADSYAGTFYVQNPGEYNVQVISEKIIALDNRKNWQNEPVNTMLMSVMLTPMSR